MKPIKILQIFTVLNKGGAETNLMNYYRNMDRGKFHFDFLVHREGGFFEEEIKNLGGNIYRLPPILPWRLKEYQKAVKEFFNTHHDYDIVHGQCSELGVFIYEEAKRRNIPVIIAHAHNNRMDRDKKLIFRLIWKFRMRKSINQYFTCGDEAAEDLFGKRLAKKSYQMNNAIEVENFKFNKEVRESKRKELGAENSYNILNIGRFTSQKNQLFLLEVFAEIIRKNKQYRLFLVGNGELKPQILEKIKKLRIERHVELLGMRNDISEILQAMDIFMFPSLFEGFGIAFLEAQVSGLKCVISEKIAIESQIVTNNIKVFSLNKSPKHWANEILKIDFSERKDASEIIRNAGYDIKENAKKLEKKYTELVTLSNFENI